MFIFYFKMKKEIELRKLNFGCGKERKEGFYNIDIIKSKGIHKSFDFNKFPYPLKDNQFDFVLCKQVLEHCLFPERVLREFKRICRENAIIRIQVPYTNSRSAYSSLDHCHFFNRWSFLNLEKLGFETLKNKMTYQRFLRWLPKPFLDFLSIFLNNIYVMIDADLKVKKEHQ